MPLSLPLLAAFVSPGLFLGGLAAAGVPVVIHLLARRRFRRVRWATIDFLIAAERRDRRRLRLEEWILLALRCLAVLLIGLVVSRPFLRPGGIAAAWGGPQRTEHIFVIDDSFSMGYESRASTSFARAKVVVQRLVESMRAEAVGDTISILRMCAPDQPLETNAYLDDDRVEAVVERLEALTTSERSINADEVINGVVDLLERSPDMVNAAVYLLGDFQRGDWVSGAAVAESEDGQGAVFDPLAAWMDEGRALRVVLVNVGDPHATNTVLSRLSVRAGPLVAGLPATITAEVANYAGDPAENLELRYAVGGVSQAPRTLDAMAARRSASVDLPVEFLHAGDESVRVEVPDDALPIDNVRYVASEVVSAIRILIVNGEPSADANEDEVTFLATALRPEGDVFSGNEVVFVNEHEVEDVNLSAYHVVILANVCRITEPAIEAMEQFVGDGGGAIFFAGDQVDAELYNAALYRNGDGILPAALTEIREVGEGAHLVIADRLHPALRAVSEAGDSLGLGRVAFFRFFGCAPFQPDERSSDATGSTDDWRPARVIARFDDADESSAIVVRPLGRGRVLLITTTADKEWNDWPDHPTYLPVMMELVRHVAKGDDPEREYEVGQPIRFSLDPRQFEPEVLVRTPAYPAEPEVSVSAPPAADGRGLTLAWERTARRGIYEFALRRRDGGEVVRLAAVNLDPEESDLAMATEEELRRSLGKVSFDYIQDRERITAVAGAARRELWPWFLFAAVAVLMGEQYLAWRWGRRRV